MLRAGALLARLWWRGAHDARARGTRREDVEAGALAAGRAALGARARVWGEWAARASWAAGRGYGAGCGQAEGKARAGGWATRGAGPRALGRGRGAAWAGEARGWAGQGKRRGMKAFSFLYFPYFFCYCVFRFWFINFEIQMNFENFE
jgi:hypothetical protein